MIAHYPGLAAGLKWLRRSSFGWAAVIAIVVAALAQARPCAAQLRVVNYNCAQLQGVSAALHDVFAALHVDDKPGFAVPVSLFVFQEVKNVNFLPLLDLVNASAPPGVSYAAATYTNINEDNFGGAQAIFYRADMLSEVTFAGTHLDIYTGGGRYTDRWRFQLLGYPNPSAWFYIYSSHLKADGGLENQNERLMGVTSIRNNADALTATPPTHIIYCGDMNFYNNAEPAYLHFLSPGNGQAFDPLGNRGWGGALNAIKHTQSPRINPLNGLIGGGLDDRFDFQLSSAAFHDGMGLSIIPGTYRAFGNDGLHHNQSINNGNNFYYPMNVPLSNFVAARLHDASDHIPLVVDYQIPAVLSATISPQPFGRVIQNAEFYVSADISNAANVVAPAGADALFFTATGLLALSGEIEGSAAALAPAFNASFPLNTATVGNKTARITITTPNQGAPAASLTLNSQGTVVRASNSSFSAAQDVNSLTVNVKLDPGSGIQQIPVNVHNYGFDALQALLDIDAVAGVSQPFGFASGLATGIAAPPATLTFTFDTTAAKPGPHQAQLTVHTSDEDLPGQMASQLALTINVSVNGTAICAGDINEDGLVNVDDLLMLLSAWGQCPECAADFNGDNLVNVDDLLTLLAAWGVCD